MRTILAVSCALGACIEKPVIVELRHQLATSQKQHVECIIERENLRGRNDQMTEWLGAARDARATK